MPFLKEKCPKCGKNADVDKEFSIGGKTVYTMKGCTHFIEKEQLLSQKGTNLVISEDHKTLLPYQKDGIDFVLRSGGRVLIADEMGLGKTVQAIGSLVVNPDMLPVLAVVKSGIKSQWQREFLRWNGADSFAQIISESTDFILPGLPMYIISYDLIPRMMKKDAGKAFIDRVKALGINTLILDECQQIKNTESQRAQAVRKLSKDMKHVIALSGTPIKNNAAEYFSILNILKPEMFSSYSRFLYQWCDTYSNGYGVKAGGLKYPNEFKERTKHFIIRRERADVLPDLPQVTRNFLFNDLAKEVEKAYAATLNDFSMEMNNVATSGMEKAASILGYMNKMRHITGISKITPTTEFVEEFLDSNERKIVIFVHHKDVGDILSQRIEQLEVTQRLGLKVLRFTSDMNADERIKAIDQFMNSSERILVASTLAAGEGLNLQKCSDCIVMERQWNPANEEQVEGRFIRIGQLSDKVTATYPVAIGTIDEFLAEIVEKKREIVGNALNNKESIEWNQSEIMNELKDRLLASNLTRWKL